MKILKFKTMFAVLLMLGTTISCESSSSDEDQSEEEGDAATNGDDTAKDKDASASDSGSSIQDSNDANANVPDDASDASDNDTEAVVQCDGAECCWIDCVTDEQSCGEFEPLEGCSIVEVPDWFERYSCVVDYDSLEPFTDGRQGIGYCACHKADQVGTAEIPIEETADGCIYTYGGDPCGQLDLSECFPEVEVDAGTSTGGSGGSSSSSECTSDSSCSSREICRDGRCVSVQCTSDSHCGSCSRCSSNVCRSCGYGPYGCYC